METPVPTQALVGKAKNGDRDAFNDLVAFHPDELDKRVRLRLGSHLRETIELEDVLQETFVRAFQSNRQLSMARRDVLSEMAEIDRGACDPGDCSEKPAGARLLP